MYRYSLYLLSKDILQVVMLVMVHMDLPRVLTKLPPVLLILVGDVIRSWVLCELLSSTHGGQVIRPLSTYSAL